MHKSGWQARVYKVLSSVLCAAMLWQAGLMSVVAYSFPDLPEQLRNEKMLGLETVDSSRLRAPQPIHAPGPVRRAGTPVPELGATSGAQPDLPRAVATAVAETPPLPALATRVPRVLSAEQIYALAVNAFPPFLPGLPHPSLRALPSTTESRLAAPLAAGDIPLIPGWNLVSIPRIVGDTDPAAVLASIAGNYSEVVAYDNCDAVDPWKRYDPADLPGSDLTAIDHTMGFWVKMTAADALDLTGAVPSSTDILLCEGWNLIGYPLDQNFPVVSAFHTIDGQYVRVFGYEPTDVDDPWEVFTVSAPAAANDLDIMQSGHGYWILASQDVTSTVEGPQGPPQVTINSHDNGDEITFPQPITGTIASGTIASWVWEYRETSDSNWTVFGSGDTQFTAQAAASFDPSLLLNGIYELRLTATDLFNQTGSASIEVLLEGQMKVGLFTISFIDLDIPVVGIPIQLVRTYDSRDKRQGDFGIGWTLDIVRGRYTNNRKPGNGWVISNSPRSGLFPSIPCSISTATKYHVSEIRFSDLDFYRFSLQVQMSGYGSAIGGGCLGAARFVQIGGVPGATLEILGDTDVFWPNGSDQLLNFATFQVYEPQEVRLTVADGRQFDLSLADGLEFIRDLNANELTIDATGITHSSGKSVDFTRDAQGRIVRITDPLGHTIEYSYDGNGDLVGVTDQVANLTRFVYNAKHDLLDIIDPRGIRAARNEYDTAGRLVAVIDANDNRTALSHNIAGRQEDITDRRGNATTYEYDDRGNVTSETDALSNVTTFTYDARDNLLSETDPLGHTTTFTYDARDNLLTRTDALGNTTSFTYDSRNRMLTLTDPRGNTTTNSYDANGNLLTTTDPLGHVATNTYDAVGNLLSTTDSLSSTTTYAYDSAGNLTQLTDALGHATTFTYDANGNQLTSATTRTNGAGNTVVMTTSNNYDAQGRLVQTVDAAGNVSSVGYDSLGKRSATIDAQGRRTEFTYDVRGHLASTTYADGTTKIAGYDLEGNRTASTDRAGRTTFHEFDVLNRQIRTTFPDGSSTSHQYDDAGYLISSTDARSNVTQFAYDAIGRTTVVTDALGNTMLFAYDASGNQISQQDANGYTTTYEYDDLNRQTRTIFPDGTASSVTYNELGRETARTDQAGNATRYEYSALGQLVRVIDALGNSTVYDYDEVGNHITQIDANGHTTLFEYDNIGRRVRRVLPLGMAEIVVYDAVGNAISKTDFNGDTIAYEYDSNNRLTRKTFPDTSSEIYSYTPTGQRGTVIDSRGTTSYVYDLRDRLTQRTDPDGRSISYTYDAAGNRSSLSIPSGTTHFSFDNLNRLDTVIDPDGGVTSYTYDAVGNRSSITYPNGTVAEYTYDSLNRLTYLLNRRSNDATISSYAYTLGLAGNRTRVVEGTGRSVEYAYDDTYRLVQESINDPLLGSRIIDYTYDPVGNRLTKSDEGIPTNYTYDANDRLLISGNIMYTYDKNGNVLAENSGSHTTLYQYDSQNRLIHATVSSSIGNSVADFMYDQDGKRVKKTLEGAVVTNYLLDSNRLYAEVLQETDSAGTNLVSYVHGDDLISQKRNNVISFFHYDAQMSTRQLTNSGGLVTDSYTYDAYGASSTAIGATANNFLYTGEQFDPNLSLYYLRARYYSATLGRFASTDPALGVNHDPRTLHKYVYAANNPLTHFDFSGESFTLPQLQVAVAVVGAIVGAVIGGAVAAHAGHNVSDPRFWLYVGAGGAVGAIAGVSLIRAFVRFGIVPQAAATGTLGASDWLARNGNNLWHIIRPAHNWDKLVRFTVPNVKENVVRNFQVIIPHLERIRLTEPTRVQQLANGGRLLIWEVKYRGLNVWMQVFENAQGIQSLSNAGIN